MRFNQTGTMLDFGSLMLDNGSMQNMCTGSQLVSVINTILSYPMWIMFI